MAAKVNLSTRVEYPLHIMEDEGPKAAPFRKSERSTSGLTLSTDFNFVVASH